MVFDILIDLFNIYIVLVVFGLFPIILRHLLSMLTLLLGVVESTDLGLVAP